LNRRGYARSVCCCSYSSCAGRSKADQTLGQRSKPHMGRRTSLFATFKVRTKHYCGGKRKSKSTQS